MEDINPITTDEDARILSSERQSDDHKEGSLRPRNLDQFIGQESTKKNLHIFLEAAKQREEAVEHLLFYGPPGLGKTSLAHIIAVEMQSQCKVTSGPAIERPGDLAAILTNLQKGDILFVDEIHRLNRSVEEVLYPALEDFQLDIIIGKGPSARSIRLDLPPFTLIGATTRLGLLSAPLRDRFGILERLALYEPAHLATIIQRAADILEMPISRQCAEQLACRSRGTPRIANRLLKRIRDWAQVKGDGTITAPLIDEALTNFGVDAIGLDSLDRDYLQAIITKFQGGPVGVDTISASLSEESESLEDVVEPFLLQRGFIERTSRGRLVTPLAYQHLGINPPQKNINQTTLF